MAQSTGRCLCRNWLRQEVKTAKRQQKGIIVVRSTEPGVGKSAQVEWVGGVATRNRKWHGGSSFHGERMHGGEEERWQEQCVA